MTINPKIFTKHTANSKKLRLTHIYLVIVINGKCNVRDSLVHGQECFSVFKLVCI